jgi:hypothetical protein
MPPAPSIVEADRHKEIKKAAEEIRSSFLKANLHEGVPHKLRVFYAALISGISDADFRVLCAYLAFGNSNADNIAVSHKRIGLLLERSERTIRRSTKELEEEGWLASKRNGRKESTRTASIPLDAMRAIVAEVLDRTNLAGRTVIEIPKLGPDRTEVAAQSTGQVCLDRPELASRPQFDRPNLAALPQFDRPNSVAIENLSSNNNIIPRVCVREEPAKLDPATNLLEADFADYNSLFNSWGRKPNDITPRLLQKRSFTDANLQGVLRGQAHHDPKLVLSAVRSTIVSMQTRSVLSAEQRAVHGSGGFGSYFQQELRGTIERLERPPQAEASKSVKPQNPNFSYNGTYIGRTL